MKATFFLQGSNEGASFLNKYNEQEVEIESLYRDIDTKSPPLGTLKTSDSELSIQLIDILFIREYIYVYCFIMKDDNGGKAMLRLKPISE